MLIFTVLYNANFVISSVESGLIQDISLRQSIFDEPYTNFEDYFNDNVLTSEDFEWENYIFYTPDNSEVQKNGNNPILNNEQENVQSSFDAGETPSVSSKSSFLELLENTEKVDETTAPEEKKGSNLEISDLKDSERNEFEDFIINIEKTEDKLICSEVLVSKFDCTIETNCNDKCNTISSKCKSEIKNLILKLIKSDISLQHVDFYIKRLECIEQAFDDIDSFEHRLKLNINLSSSHDSELISLLKMVRVKFNIRSEFNKKTIEIFSKTFDSEFSTKMDLLRIIFDNEQSVYFDKYNFYFELMNLYKYIDEIPELMSLCGIYTNRVFCATPSILHLMNLFCEHIGNIRENRVFILCLINKAITYSNRRDLDLFLVEKYKIVCLRKHPNLHFLFWEFGLAKRNDIRRKLKQSDILIFNEVDKQHLKTIFLIYLYQHTYFLSFYKFKCEEFETFSKFFERVLFSEGCFACHFDEYLEIIEKQLKNFE